MSMTRSAAGGDRITAGQPEQAEVRARLDAFIVDASLPAGMTFPFDFGFFPGTKAADGDPLDVLVLMDSPGYPGVIVPVRMLGVLEGTQSDDGGKPYRNDRLIAVADGTTERGNLRRIKDLDAQLMRQIESFFKTYAGLKDKTFTYRAIVGRASRSACSNRRPGSLERAAERPGPLGILLGPRNGGVRGDGVVAVRRAGPRPAALASLDGHGLRSLLQHPGACDCNAPPFGRQAEAARQEPVSWRWTCSSPPRPHPRSLKDGARPARRLVCR